MNNTKETRDNWTPARIDQLRKLHAERKSAAIIGAMLGMTRNAVLGKIMRLGLSTPTPELRKPKTQTLVRKTRTPSLPALVASNKPRAMPLLPPPVTGRITILELTGCKWPVDYDAGQHTLCDAEKAEGDARYCPYHRKMSGPQVAS